MNTVLDCIPCFVRQALDAARLFTDEPAIHEQAVRDVLRTAASMDFNQSPPAMGQWVHRHLREMTGHADPYRSHKDRDNQLAMSLLPDLRARLKERADPFGLAVRLAIAGNVIDRGVNGQLREEDVRRAVDDALAEPLLGDPEALRQAASRARNILYLADNAGEIVFDGLLIEQLPSDRVVLVVRGASVLNDATLADAQAAKLHEIVRVIDNGSDAPGTLLQDCSTAFRKLFEQADLIIAKGQGNFETLSDTGHHVFFLFKAKCPVIARQAGVAVGTNVLLNHMPIDDRGAEPAVPPARSRPNATDIRAEAPDRTAAAYRKKAGTGGMAIPADLQRCVDFHGHLCPGLVVGYCAAKVGMQRLEVDRSSDEELIAIVENDSCAVDAVQLLTGCTFGKGNLLFRDYGKMVFTFAARPTGRSVRLCLRFNPPPQIDPTPAEELRQRKVEYILSQPPDHLFCIREETIELPRTARLHDSVPCESCGEMVMVTRTRRQGRRSLCIPCADYRIKRMQ
jgi:uncharacterized protein with ATP-grasp and redox domains/formylmethanofuran dehydrogenase subunit E